MRQVPITIQHRPAKPGDENLLLFWRNEDEAVKFSVTGRKVTLEEHRQWFSRILNGQTSQIYIFEAENQPIGMVRADERKPHEFELSWTVDKSQRGKGYAKQMVKTIVDLLVPRSQVTARILVQNESSKRIAIYSGLKFFSVEGEVETWRKN